MRQGAIVSDATSISIIAGELLCAGALLLVAWLVWRNGAAQAARHAEAVERRRRRMDELLRLRLLERRLAVHARLDALWLCWARCERPGEALLAGAAAAVEEAKLVFPAELQPGLDEAASLLLASIRHLGWREEAIERGRHGERVALLDREAELEQALKPKIAGLRTVLLEATRPAGAA
jgi:hypothetical protein